MSSNRKKSAQLFQKGNFHHFDDPKDDSQTEGIRIVTDVTLKELAKAQRDVNLAQARGMLISKIMSHDLESSPLFDGDLPRHAEKATLVSEIDDNTTSKPA